MNNGNFERAKILVVDDVPEKLLAVEVVLESLNQEIVSVRSGDEALRQLLADDFAVILLDVNMPGMDGFETASLIRRRRRSEHTPIIFLTAFPDDAFAARGYSLGAVDYILTPVVPEVLRTKVSVFVQLYQMTEQVKRQAEQRIALAQEHAARLAAERANRAKNEFLANVSHELRTPMNAIIGMTDLALDEELSAPVRENLEVVRSNAHWLLQVMNQILDLSKLDSGKFTLECRPFDLRELIGQLIGSLQFRAREKGIKLTSTITPEAPPRLIGDPLRLRQVLLNLLSNAVKFTERGQVSLQVDVEPQESGALQFSFTVADTGIGIAADDLERIFAPFTQVDSSLTRRFGGTGLGLAIASDLVREMGGRLTVASELGYGSTFAFLVPLGVDAAPRQDVASPATPEGEAATRPTAPPPPAARPLRILLVEDTPTNQKLVCRVLDKRGHIVEVASDGAAAIELARRNRYDVVLMDLQMPEMDGFEATATIRGLPGVPSTLPIIALTAHAMTGDRDRCLAGGMDDYLAKPLDSRVLVETVERWALAKSAAPSAC